MTLAPMSACKWTHATERTNLNGFYMTSGVTEHFGEPPQIEQKNTCTVLQPLVKHTWVIAVNTGTWRVQAKAGANTMASTTGGSNHLRSTNKKRCWGSKTCSNGKRRECTGWNSGSVKRILKEEFVQLRGGLRAEAQFKSILRRVIWTAGHKEEQCTHRSHHLHQHQPGIGFSP